MQWVVVDLTGTDSVPLGPADVCDLIEQGTRITDSAEVLEGARLPETLIVLMQDDRVERSAMSPLVRRLVLLYPVTEVHKDVSDVGTWPSQETRVLQRPLVEPKLERIPVYFHTQTQAALRVDQSMEGLRRVDRLVEWFSVRIKDDSSDLVHDRLAANTKSLDVYHQIHTFLLLSFNVS